jgi:hypothetical protein
MGKSSVKWNGIVFNCMTLGRFINTYLDTVQALEREGG